MGRIAVDYKTLGMMGTNCYFVCNVDTMETVIIDPAYDAGTIFEIVQNKGYIPKAVFLTHGHFDHIMAVKDVCRRYGIQSYAYTAEQEVLESSYVNLSQEFSAPYVMTADILVNDEDIIEMADIKFKVLHTPGHTKGSCCYYIEEANVLISGDTIFNTSVGRTDFPTGSSNELLRSIRDRIFVLPDETVVYPGHGDSTTIAYEKINNCCVQYFNGDYNF